MWASQSCATHLSGGGSSFLTLCLRTTTCSTLQSVGDTCLPNLLGATWEKILWVRSRFWHRGISEALPPGYLETRSWGSMSLPSHTCCPLESCWCKKAGANSCATRYHYMHEASSLRQFLPVCARSSCKHTQCQNFVKGHIVVGNLAHSPWLKNWLVGFVFCSTSTNSAAKMPQHQDHWQGYFWKLFWGSIMLFCQVKNSLKNWPEPDKK